MNKSIYKKQRRLILESLDYYKYSQFEFSLTKKYNPSPFATIFSIFIRDLFNYQFEGDEKLFLVDYLQSLQDPQTGLFCANDINNYTNPFYIKECLQLTTFALSALSILDSVPKHQIKHNIKSCDDVYSYLDKVGVKDGVLGNGNFAMFLGIFLSLDKINSISNLIDYWFAYHTKHYNKKNGVWTSGIKTQSQWSYQNGLHQFIIYEYWNKNAPNYKKIIDIILNNVDKKGTFALLPGGGACCDYDAVHLLNIFGIKKNYRKDEIMNILNLTYSHILEMGEKGFCENSYVKNLSLPKDLHKFYNSNLISTAFRIKEFMHVKKNDFTHHPHWSRLPIKLSSQDLWSIWFRLLVIAEIEEVFLENNNWKFHKFPGLGILINNK